MDLQSYESRGYLREDFRLFHLYDAITEPVDWHYHTFHKIILFLSGSASYGIEGTSYPLRAGDIILVPSGCIHRPETEPDAPYERVIVYISPEFLRRCSTHSCDLEQCFALAKEEFSFVVRPKGSRRDLAQIVKRLEQETQATGFGQELLVQSLFFQFLISISRGVSEHELRYVHAGVCDEKTVAILQYLSAHLTEPLRIDDLASHFYISKYHMMRRFKEETGYTIHNYLNNKRLMLAREMIADGRSVNDACFACGFRDYSTFARAYKRLFSQPPRAAK